MLRLLDANLNRIREGLRVLEEVARFVLEDAALTERLKRARHDLAQAVSLPDAHLLAERNAAGDVGAPLDLPDELERAGLGALVRANSRRVQEALRVLEECAKLPDLRGQLQAPPLEQMRFVLYDLERELMGRLARRERRGLLRGLYVILDPEVGGERDMVAVAQAALAGGARALQLRDKRHDKGEQLPLARHLATLCRERGTLFFVNDHVDLAMVSGAQGVHLGQKDLPLPEARRLVPLEMLIGVSTNNPQEALRAQEEGADYVAVGRLFPTTSKAATRPATLDTLKAVKAAVSLPVVAIGGINESNAGMVVEAGADMMAVISAVVGAADVEGAARRLAGAFPGP